jgi:hypothetical protein
MRTDSVVISTHQEPQGAQVWLWEWRGQGRNPRTMADVLAVVNGHVQVRTLPAWYRVAIEDRRSIKRGNLSGAAKTAPYGEDPSHNRRPPGNETGVSERGASGSSSDDPRDMTTLGEQRTRGSGGLRRAGKDGATAGPQARLIDAQRINARELNVQAKASANWLESGRMGEPPLTPDPTRQAAADGDAPGFKPYWGKPTVRNFRGGLETCPWESD